MHKGVVLPTANNLITFDIKRTGKIIGVDNGELRSNEPYKANKRTVFMGKSLVIIQSAPAPGAIYFTATSVDLR